MSEDKKFRLECECHDMRCFIGFWFYIWEPEHAAELEIPGLDINVQWYPGNVFKRLKTAWKVIRRNDWREDTEVTVLSYEKIRQLRDFLNDCLEQEKKP